MSSKFSVLQTTPDENSNLLLKSKMSNNSSGSERKTLQTLQLSADGKLTGLQHPHSPGKKMVRKITASKKPLAVYTDKKALPVERGIQTDKQVEIEAGTQTEVSGTSGLDNPVSDSHNDSGVCPEDIDQEAYDLMVKEEVPESYWRDLAEERRLSLAEALSENELLHQSMEELKEENHNLSLVAGQAEYFANMLNSVLDDSKSEAKDEGDNSELSGDHSDAEEIKKEDKQSNLNEEQTVDQVDDTSKDDSNKIAKSP